MNAYIIILLFISNTLADYEPYGYYPNVGTVLFTSSDIYKNTWMKNQIGLLRARRDFQTCIPPAEMINSLNGDFIDKLISYFKHSYSLVKKEASNPVDDIILTSALSDVIGGYLKVWALPITRYAFYGGSISSEKALNLHKFYEKVKNYLGTDGVGWRDPDPNLLHSIEINVAPRRVTNTRHQSDPCENLAFFEKSTTGLSIPVPHVNWDDRSYTMFIPLRNESLISLTSPKTSDALFRYYDTAKNCMQTTSSHDQNQFDEKFQDWLLKDVIPHLNDDNLYLAFGSILTLVNKTKSLCDTVIDLCASSANNTREKFSIAGFPINITSKKMMIISVIFFLEIVWCVPALIYLICVKKKKAKDNESNVYLHLDSKNRKGRRPKNIETSSRVEIDIGTDPDPTTTGGLKLSQKPRRKNTESETKQKAVATECTSSFISKSHCVDTRLVNYESRSLQLRSSLKKIPEPNNSISTSSQEVLIDSPDKASIGQCESYSTVQKLDITKTVTLLKENGKENKNSTADIKSDKKNGNKEKKTRKQQLKVENSKTVASVTPVKSEEVTECLCTCCLNEDASDFIPDNKTTNQTSATVVALCSRCSKCSMKNSGTITNFSQNQLQKETKPSKHRAVKVSCNKKPYVEITIDRQQRDICLEISGTAKKNKTNNAAEIKPSKIPTRAVMYCPGHATLVTSKKAHSPLTSLKKKSLIPQLKKRPADDSEIRRKKPGSKHSKLNVTF